MCRYIVMTHGRPHLSSLHDSDLFGERDVCPHCSVVAGLAGAEVVTQGRLLHHRSVALPQTVEQLHLLLAEVERLVHHGPGDGLPAARVGGAPLHDWVTVWPLMCCSPRM